MHFEYISFSTLHEKTTTSWQPIFSSIFGCITYGLLLFKLYMIWSLTCLHRVVNIPRSIQPDLVTGEFIVNLLEWTNKGQSVNMTL